MLEQNIADASLRQLHDPPDAARDCKHCLACLYDTKLISGPGRLPTFGHSTILAQCCLLKAPLLCSLGPCNKAVMDAVLSSDDLLCGCPDSLILDMLERDNWLTRAKLHELSFERLTKKTQVYHLRRLVNLVGVVKGSHMLCVWASLSVAVSDAVLHPLGRFLMQRPASLWLTTLLPPAVTVCIAETFGSVMMLTEQGESGGGGGVGVEQGYRAG